VAMRGVCRASADDQIADLQGRAGLEGDDVEHEVDLDLLADRALRFRF